MTTFERIDSRMAALHDALRDAVATATPTLLDELIGGKLDVPLPGLGETFLRFQILRVLGRHDLSLARLVEGHIDAKAILAEAGMTEGPEGSLGVWAAGPVDDLRAVQTRTGWRLDGTRRWCSGARTLSRALVRAAAGDGERLFLVPLDLDGILPRDDTWPALGMAATETLDVTFDAVELPASTAIGEPGFYLDRLGFWFGAVGVAAVWLGGAEAVASAVATRAGQSPHRLAHLGWITARIAANAALLEATAEMIDDATSDSRLIERAARIARIEIADAAAEIVERTGRATGADPLAHDRAHARRVADLTLYIRQTHAEADLEELGRLELMSRTEGAADDL